MEKIIFEDLPSTKTPLNAENLNKIQENVETAINETNTNLKTLINGVVESGSNDNGNWIKFADGTMICYGDKNLSPITVDVAWGSMYESANKYDLGSFPQEFKAVPSLSIIQKDGATVWLETLGGATTTTNLGLTWLVSPVVRVGKDCILSYIAIGKWK